MKQTRRSFVRKLDFITSLGHGEGGDDRARHGVVTKGPTRVMTDLCVLEPEPVGKELWVTSIHPGVTREQIAEQTGWPVRFAPDAIETPAPTSEELEVLRPLHARTAAAHGDEDQSEAA
jgi:glutaconate CoA-transferase, subunit B